MRFITDRPHVLYNPLFCLNIDHFHIVVGFFFNNDVLVLALSVVCALLLVIYICTIFYMCMRR